MRLLITGAAGMLGGDVADAACRAGHEVVAFGRAELDVTDARAVRAAVAEAGPDTVVHCAAWTDVDGAEANEELATAVNAGGARNVAEAAAAAGAFVVAVSTDYVFDGRAREPYAESDTPDPLGAYGRSKLAGEQAVAAAAPDGHAIVRTSWLFGSHGPNFVATMLRLADGREELTVVDDQVGCPTYTAHLAPALLTVGEQRRTGVLHVAGSGCCSWWDLARATFEAAGHEIRLHPGRTEDLGRPAPRPAWSVLRSERPDAPVLPAWQDGLAAYLETQGVRA
jgi:dTDP-4-dehydrorhamnose reductase